MRSPLDGCFAGNAVPVVTVALLLCLVRAQTAAPGANLYLLVSRSHAEVFGDTTKCSAFAVATLDAVRVATQATPAEIGSIDLPCQETIVVNRSFSVAKIECLLPSSCDALQALAEFRAWNGVKGLGIVAATRKFETDDRSKEEGLAAYAVVLAGSLVFVGSSAISTFCFRRSATRRARSVKFKDLVRFEIELAGDDGGDDGVPLPISHPSGVRGQRPPDGAHHDL
jgi:hypothetical protein